MFEKYTAYQPVQTTTTTTTWNGWQIVNPKCCGCIHSRIRFGKLVCYKASRTMKSDGTCLNYSGRDAR